MEVELRHERNPRVKDPDRVEVTVRTPGETIRVHGEGLDHFAAIDIAADRLETQIKKHKERLDRPQPPRRRQPPVTGTVAGRTTPTRRSEHRSRCVRRSTSRSRRRRPGSSSTTADCTFVFFTNAESMRPAVLFKRRPRRLRPDRARELERQPMTEHDPRPRRRRPRPVPSGRSPPSSRTKRTSSSSAKRTTAKKRSRWPPSSSRTSS